MNVTPELLRGLPKTDLHCHLDGSLRHETLIELAAKIGYQLPPPEFGLVHESLNSYLKMFDGVFAVMQTEAAIERIAYELAEDAANENVWHLEVRFSPWLLTKRGLTADQVLKAALNGFRQATKRHGISVVVIVCALRHLPPDMNVEAAKLAVRFRDQGVTGFDLAGPEIEFPVTLHKEALDYARSHGLFLTVHAGEAVGPESIEKSVFECHAQRIGHGTTLVLDRDLMRYFEKTQIPVECCITSNLQTGIIDDVQKHPLKQFMDAGVKATINTDNRLMSETTVSKELWITHERLGFGLDQIKLIVQNGFESAFLPAPEKNALLERLRKFHDAHQHHPSR